MKTEVAANVQQSRRPAIFTLVEGDAFSRKLQTISQAIAHRAYELFECDGRRDGHDLQNWYRAESEFLQSVPLEIVETDHVITVRAYIPGFKDKRAEVRVGPHRLVISGKIERFGRKSTGVQPTEICSSLDLLAEVEPSNVTATFIKGGIEVELPKVAADKQLPIRGKAA